MKRFLPAFLAIAVVALVWNSSAATAVHKKKNTSAAKRTSAPKATGAHKTPAKGKAAGGKRTASSSRRRGKSVSRTTWRNRQALPSPERYKQIQEALVAKGFLSADDATGVWNQTSIDALKKFQAAQNLDAKGKINSLSLIALGLGPKYDAVKSPVLQPQTPPPAPQTQPAPPQTQPPAAVNNAADGR
jgi:Ni/Co efflux regulator RcnB